MSFAVSPEITPLVWTAAGIGFIHTVAGPDHYLPFILLGRARDWSLGKTLRMTLLCGLGHVTGSMVLGLAGISLGVAVRRLVDIESLRGEMAAWGLVAFGLVYLVWGLRRAHRHRQHSHLHSHFDGTVHLHEHVHEKGHVHVHEPPAERVGFTPWALFILFVLGPCEALIPLLMVPAAQSSMAGVALVAGIFGLVTIATMTTVVAVSYRGVRRLSLGRLDRYAHALAGGALALSGLLMVQLGG